MKYLRQFNSETEYLDFKEAPDYITPNVSFITDSETVMYNEYIPPILLCDIAYWDGSNVKTTTLNNWSESLGTPIGVVVIPEGFLPDGKARMIGLKPVDESGNASSSHSRMKWGATGTDTPLTYFNRVPITDNSGSTTTGSDSWGYLPSDKLTGTQSFVDPFAKYNATSKLIPSPYLGDNKTFNPAYSEIITNYNNALSDFNGLTNTETLVGLGSVYIAANAAWNYSDGVSSTQWYLPAMGELGFLMPRFNMINESITAVGGIAVDGSLAFWSSSEYDSYDAYRLGTSNGYMGDDGKSYVSYVRPFGML